MAWFVFLTASFAVLLGMVALVVAILPWPGTLARNKDQPSTALME